MEKVFIVTIAFAISMMVGYMIYGNFKLVGNKKVGAFMFVFTVVIAVTGVIVYEWNLSDDIWYLITSVYIAVLAIVEMTIWIKKD